MSRDWRTVQYFSLDGRHFVFPSVTVNKIETIENDGRTVVLFATPRTIVCSNFGDDTRLLQYDLRPQPFYTFADGALWPSHKGTETVSGYYPSYVHDQTGQQVWIGPKLNFYGEPQEDIMTLAMAGKLLVDLRHARLCETCHGLIPVWAGPAAKFCSSECGLRTRQDIAKEHRAARKAKQMRRVLLDTLKPPPRGCSTCEGPIDFKVRGTNAKYCCDECRPDHESKDERPLVKCYHCGIPFRSGRHGTRFYCSPRCRAGIGPRFPMPEGKSS